MEVGFFRSPIEAVAITLCLAGSFLLYKQKKHYSLLLVCLGFAGPDYLQDYPYLCSPVIPYIKSGGYFLIGYGLIQFSEHLKNA